MHYDKLLKMICASNLTMLTKVGQNLMEIKGRTSSEMDMNASQLNSSEE